MFREKEILAQLDILENKIDKLFIAIKALRIKGVKKDDVQ